MLAYEPCKKLTLKLIFGEWRAGRKRRTAEPVYSEEADAMSPAHVTSKQSLIYYAAAVVCRVNRMPCG